jgi:hypothetical protein
VSIRKKALGLLSLVVILGIYRLLNGQPPSELKLSLSAMLNADRSLDLRVVVRNEREGPISVNIPETNPIRITIMNENGQDVYGFAYADRDRIKDGKSGRPGTGQRNVTLALQGNQTKEYTFKVRNVQETGAGPTPLKPGKYSIQVRLATVKYVAGEYKTDLYLSNVVDILIKP